MVSPELSATARHHAWRLPASAGMTGVLLRVVATDLRFQTTSDATTLDVAAGGLPDAAPGSSAAGRPKATSLTLR
jgi:hypothetical protein